jgi:hypothetical protein
MRIPIHKLVLVLVILATPLLVGNLFAQTAVVSGTVAYRNGNPAVNVTVSIAGRASLTDVRGRYRVPDVPFGRQTLRILQNRKVLKELVVNVNAAAVTHNETLP